MINKIYALEFLHYTSHFHTKNMVNTFENVGLQQLFDRYFGDPYPVKKYNTHLQERYL